MPNHVILASGAVVAVSVAVATAIALYENPELRRYADDVRRRIAIALNGGDRRTASGEPIFNRPEDAEGFLRSRGRGDPDGVEADEETRRRQMQELMYWNSQLLEKKAKEEKDGGASADRKRVARRGSSFDDFLRRDENAEEGTFVFNSGADVRSGNEGLRNRGEGARGLTSVYANPFADEFNIESDEIEMRDNTKAVPVKGEAMSDIYSATTTHDQDDYVSAPGVATPEPNAAALIDVDPTPSHSDSTATLERELEPNEFMTAGQEDRDEAYASIQAWAQNSSPDFYSPLPTTPVAPVSEPELVSEGQLTPTDSVSVIGSGEDVANDAQSSRAGETGRYYDVISESESEGMATPSSWSEVGSVVSESDGPVPVRN